MKSGEVERWVVTVVDQVERGHRVEDDRVECKRLLVDDHDKAARRIAGHANQARQDRILWVIGVDEAADPPVVGRAPSEPDAADWWTRVEARFDDVAPSPTWVNVPVSESRSVLGVGLDTSRPPYVVRLASDNPSREVPWREGTRIRTANRFDLLKLLVPLADRPRVSVLGGSLTVIRERKDHRHTEPLDTLRWDGTVQLYVDCVSPFVIPAHRCFGRVVFDTGHELSVEVEPQARTPSQPMAVVDRPNFLSSGVPSLLAEQGERQVVVKGSSPIRLSLHAWWDLTDEQFIGSAGRMYITMQTAGVDPLAIDLVTDLERLSDVPPSIAPWITVASWRIAPD
jgi:hypothetical protein